MGFNVQMLIGVPLPWPNEIIPECCIALEGQQIDRNQFPILYQIYGDTLPDLRDQFIRGTSQTRKPLTKQNDQIQSHVHPMTIFNRNSKGYNNNGLTFQHYRNNDYYNIKTPNTAYRTSWWNGNGGGSIYNELHSPGYWAATITGLPLSDSNVDSNETRPKNIAFRYICIAG